MFFVPASFVSRVATAAILSSGFFLSFSLPARAQGTRADYERAAKLSEATRGKVIHGAVKPNWIARSDRFWYLDDLGEGKRAYILVEPAKSTQRPAFDHARMAAALSKTLERTIAPERLPLDRLEFEKNYLVVQSAGQAWRCDLATYALTRHEAGLKTLPALAPRNAPRASRTTGEDTSITFVNQGGSEVLLFWLDTAGQPKPYGSPLRPGEQRVLHTYAGHAWRVTDKTGTALAVFVGEAEPGTALIPLEPLKPTRSTPVKRRATGAESPDGKWAAIVREHNVFLRDTVTQQETPLTQNGSPENGYVGAAIWSPDSKKLVVYKELRGQEHKIYIVESSPRSQKQPKLHSYDYLKPGDRIAQSKPHLFEVADKREIPISDALFPNPWDTGETHWSPDSKNFSFLYNQRGHQVLRVISVNAATGVATALVDERSKTFIDYAGKFYLRHLDKTGEILWMSERDGWNHLYRYEAKTGQTKNVTQGNWVVRGVERVDPATRRIWFRASGVFAGQDPYYVHYGRIGFDGTGLTWLTRADGTHTVSYSPDNKYIVDTYSRVDLPPVTELRRADNGALVMPLAKADATPLLATGWRYPERFVAKARDGITDIYGVLYHPANFDPAKKYPVVEQIYAGPQSSYVPKGFSAFHSPQKLAEIGFIVVQIDGMGTSNRSKAFHDVCWKNLGDAGFPDRILWMQAAAKRYPWMDISRVGVYGGSAGGQNAARAVMAFSDFYKAAVADCGCHDNQMDKIWWNELWMGWPVGPEYEAQSNVTHAKNMRGALLLIVGEMDTNVDPASTMQVVDALIKADKDFDLLVIPGAGHGAGGSPYGRRRTEDFFVRHLLGVEPRSSGTATVAAQ